MGEDTGKGRFDLTESETLAAKGRTIESQRHEFPVKNWDKYRFVSYIGEGGMGRVYKAVDTTLNRAVALKFIRGEDPDLIQRFIREARAQASVHHENVCEIYEAGEVEGKLYIAMQFIEGQTINQISSITTIEQKIAIMKSAAEGLHAAHKLGLIHRDIKPGNIMVEKQEDGSYRPYVMDFGLVRQTESGEMTLTGTTLIGTPEFMAPEQARGDLQKLDHRVDIYALGATLYALLSGRPPFTSNSTLELLKKVLEEDPSPIATIVPGLPADLDTIVMKCLEKEPERRYESAKAVADDLQRFLDAEPVLARRPTITYKLAKKARKNKVLVSVSSIAITAILVLAAYLIRAELQARKSAEIAQQFGQKVERIEAIMRIAHTIPLHNTSIEKRIVQNYMNEIRSQMKTLGSAAAGPGNYALARGYLSLENHVEAQKHLQAAWQQGYRNPEAAYAMGLVYGKLYQKELEAVENIRNKDAREERKREIEKLYKIPAVSYLKQSNLSQMAAPEYVEGLIHFYEKRFDAALSKAAAAMKRLPWLYEARILEGNIYMAIGNENRGSGNTQKAMEAYRKVAGAYDAAIRIGESDVEAYAGLCTLWTNIMYTQIYSTGEEIGSALQKAETSCGQALVADPTRGNVHTKLANAYWLWAEYQRLHGENSEAALNRSIAAAQNAIQLDPQDALAHKNIGTAYQMLGSGAERRNENPSKFLDLAIESYDKALVVNASDFTIYNSLGNTYAIRGDSDRNFGKDPTPHYQLAIKTFEKGIEINPKFPYIYSNLGVTYKDLANHQLSRGKLAEADQTLEKAILNYEKALDLKPDDIYAYNNLGNALKTVAEQQEKRGKDPSATAKRAEEALRKAMQINPEYPTPYSNLAEVFRIRASYEMKHNRDPRSYLQESLSYCRKGSSINPKDANFLMETGITHMMLARYEISKNQPVVSLAAAEEAIEKAGKLTSGNPYYWQRLGELKLMQAKEKWKAKKSASLEIESARKALNEALSINPYNAHAFRILADVYKLEAGTKRGSDAQSMIVEGLKAADRSLEINPHFNEASVIKNALMTMKDQD